MGEDDMRTLYAGLKELGVKIDNLTELFNHAAYGDGFTRCAAQDRRLRHVEDGVAQCHKSIGGVKRWLVAGLVSVISILANFVWNMVSASMRNHQ